MASLVDVLCREVTFFLVLWLHVHRTQTAVIPAHATANCRMVDFVRSLRQQLLCVVAFVTAEHRVVGGWGFR